MIKVLDIIYLLKKVNRNLWISKSLLNGRACWEIPLC